MRKNRKMPKKMSVMAGRSVQIGALIITCFAMVILNMLASSSCKQLENTIGEKKRQIDSLEDSYKREKANWEKMLTPANLEQALLRHGLAMKFPKTEQVVRMDAAGRPYPGQRSVARATQRNKAAQSAKYTPVANPVRRMAAPRTRR
ncbi:MAG: hypothetical protein IJI36_06925 [Kiritimatiellae bacterium]|jgi:hypothetical protein|nr:hypothetical protein [Kiritimatiellia bacterium]MBQ6338861.1 hypothetical protein [Kiritimatiellia bacterium]